jgi:signal transduction histidine kinase
VSRNRGAPTTATTSHQRSAPEGFSRLAAALASTDDAGTRLESRFVLLTVATRWVLLATGTVFGILTPPANGHFAPAIVTLVAFALVSTIVEARSISLVVVQILTVAEIVLTLGAAMTTGGIRSPFALMPIIALLLAGYVWGRHAVVGTAVAGAIAAIAAILIRQAAPTAEGSAGQLAAIYLLCGALGAFTRNLVVEMEAQRAAAVDQATQMATANDLLVSLHALAQTLPASFDLGEVVESIHQRVRALFPYTALVVLIPDDAGSGWRAELVEGVRVPARLAERDLPQPVLRSMNSHGTVVVTDRIAQPGEDGFAALCRSGLYTALRARGALVGLVAIEHIPANAYDADERELLESLSSVLALSLDNARWFGRLHTLGAEAERGRIARELHDRIAQSLAYVTFELERLQLLPGEKLEELENLHDVTRDIMQELRETIYQLRANVSEHDDLASIATDYLARFEERTGIATSWTSETMRRLPYRVEREVWRIVQEALANIDRHSGATNVSVRWDVEDAGARLEISDDGRGFDPGRVAGDHYGLVGMRERADAIGARLSIVSRTGKGTSVVVELDASATPRRHERRTA